MFLADIARNENGDQGVRDKAINALGVIAQDGKQDEFVHAYAVGVLKNVGGEEAEKALREIDQNEEMDGEIRSLDAEPLD